jgi:hypothetical protein
LADPGEIDHDRVGDEAHPLPGCYGLATEGRILSQAEGIHRSLGNGPLGAVGTGWGQGWCLPIVAALSRELGRSDFVEILLLGGPLKREFYAEKAGSQRSFRNLEK